MELLVSELEQVIKQPGQPKEHNKVNLEGSWVTESTNIENDSRIDITDKLCNM